MVELSLVHFVYIIMTIIIIITLLRKKEIVFPCIIGILLLAIVSSKSILKSIQMLYNSLVSSGSEFLGIIIVIALVVSMSRALNSIGADEVMIKPLKKIVKTKKAAFIVLGLVMFLASWFIWPSPAVALVGAIMLPVASEVGLPAIWAACAMNLFGHGFAMSGDYVIQGAPAISSKAAGIDIDLLLSGKSTILWFVMGIVTVSVAFIMLCREMKTHPVNQELCEMKKKDENVKYPLFTYFIAVITPLAFIVDVILMSKLKIIGGDATALVGGTAMIIMCLITICNKNLSESFEKITDNIKDGFIFAIKIFAPVIVIAAFFFLGSGDFAVKILGEGAPAILNDLGVFLSNKIQMARGPIALIQTSVGIITGLDGSGFSGLPLVGSISQTFAATTDFNIEILTTLGQISTIYVGGGTIIPWGVIPVAAICNVKATDLARKNLIPVGIGLTVTTILAMFFL